VNPFFAIQELQAIERHKNKYSILEKQKRVMDSESKDQVQERRT
jgi:hypothetical protein